MNYNKKKSSEISKINKQEKACTQPKGKGLVCILQETRFFSVLIFLFVLGLKLFTACAADSPYWREFETMERKGITLVEHIQNLSTVSGQESSRERIIKKTLWLISFLRAVN